jgi:phage terminase large subunit
VAEPRRVVTGYTARPQFVPLHQRTERWAINVSHVRGGKTVAAVNDLIDASLRCQLPDPRHAYVAPFFAQAKDTAWLYLKRYTAMIPGAVAHESELRVDMPGGRRVRLYGSDNYKRLAGLYFDGVVMDEYGDQDPRAWEEVIRARLSDRNGWALFIGTPQGQNHFSKAWDEAQANPEWFKQMLRASETGILPQAELDSARRDMSEELYLAQYECDFKASVVGSYFGKAMSAAEADKRITRVPYQAEIGVDTWWDLGIDDAMAIWFTQNVGREVHVIDYYEDSGGGLPAAARALQERGYVYATHNAPHDIRVRELGSGKSRLETAASLGIRFAIVPDIGLADGIEAARNFIARCWFDAAKTAVGRTALVSYHRLWDGKRKVFNSMPFHNWASNSADAYRYLAVGHKTASIKPRPAQGRTLVSSGASGAWMAT